MGGSIRGMRVGWKPAAYQIGDANGMGSGEKDGRGRGCRDILCSGGLPPQKPQVRAAALRRRVYRCRFYPVRDTRMYTVSLAIAALLLDSPDPALSTTHMASHWSRHPGTTTRQLPVPTHKFDTFNLLVAESESVNELAGVVHVQI